MKKKLIVYTDGAARNNPGPAGIGIVIKNSSEKTIKEINEYIGKATNNVAEYRAVIRALEEVNKIGASTVDFFLDSELVVKQLNGLYRVRDVNLQQLLLRVRELEKDIDDIKFSYVPRENNKEADKLANIAINLRDY